MPTRAKRLAVHSLARVAAPVFGVLCAFAGADPARAQDTVPPPTDTASVPIVLGAGSDSIEIRAGAQTIPGRAITRVLQRPHLVIDGRGRPVHLPRNASYESSVVVLSPRVTVGAQVQGDILVIGGDLFLHPGARISGDAIATGGGVYPSSLASLEGTALAFRDESFTVERIDGVIALAYEPTRVEYESSPIVWPLRTGLRMPAYTRVDGVVLPWGPIITLSRGRYTFEPTLTYRSDLGNVDPALRFAVDGGAYRFTADARRGTFSNDRWIRSELLNSLTTLWAGRDTRNYYRADRIEARVTRRILTGMLQLEPYVGGRNELAWSTGGELSRDSHPWSFFGRDSIDGIFRPNPAVDHIRIVSGLVGASLLWTPADLRLQLLVDYEQAIDRDEAGMSQGDDFRQLTVHARTSFPTFAGQRLDARVRAITSSSGTRRPPRQRYSYIGGSGTIPTMDLLEEGGSELFFFGTSYHIPVRRIQLPYLGSPTFTLRYLTGAAGVDSLPKLTQNVGARVAARFVGLEYLIDPATKEDRWALGLTLTF